MGNWYTDDVKYIAGVGEARAKLLDKELGIATVGDLLYHFPFRYIDRTKIYRIAEIGASGQTLVQFRGRVTGVAYAGAGRKRRFTAYVADATGQAELVWFQGIKWIEKRIEVGREYLVFGRPSFFRNDGRPKTRYSAARRSSATNSRWCIPKWRPSKRRWRGVPRAVCRGSTPRPSGCRRCWEPKGFIRS